jgi:hypothetical protein
MLPKVRATFAALIAVVFLMSAFTRRPFRTIVSCRRHTVYLSQSSCDHESGFFFGVGALHGLLKGAFKPF